MLAAGPRYNPEWVQSPLTARARTAERLLEPGAGLSRRFRAARGNGGRGESVPVIENRHSVVGKPLSDGPRRSHRCRLSYSSSPARSVRPGSIHQPEQSDRDQRDPDDEQHDEGRRPQSDANDEQHRQRKDNEENREQDLHGELLYVSVKRTYAEMTGQASA